jgi:hypothetical protein
MALETRTVTYRDITLTVSEASVETGMRRSRLKMDAQRELGQGFDPGHNDMHLMRVIGYPDLMGALVACEGIDPPATFEAFLQLPDALITLWMDATYALNPHWLTVPQAGQEAANQKKLSSSPSASTARKRHKARIQTPTKPQ